MPLRLKVFRYPLVRQYDQRDCGPAALLSVLRYYGGNSHLAHLRELCNTGLNGTTMLDMVNAANKLGFEAYGARGEYDELAKEKMPCIAHVTLENSLSHFVVIYRIEKHKIYIADPAKGKYWLSKERFLKIWGSKAVVLLRPQESIFKQPVSKWYKWTLSYLRNEESWIYQSLFLGMMYAALGLLTALFLQLIIDKFIPQKEYSKIVYSAIFLFAVLLLRVFAGYFQQRFLIDLNKEVNLKINADFLDHLFRLSKRFFDTRKIGDVTARMNDAVRIQRAMLEVTGTTLVDLLMICGSLGFMFYFSARLALLSLTLVPSYGIVLFMNIDRLKGQQNEVMKGYADVESIFINSLNGIGEIIGFNAANFFSTLNKLFFKQFQERVKNLGITHSRLNLVTGALGGLTLIVLLAFGAIEAVYGKVLLGELMAAYSLLGNVLPAVNRLVSADIDIQESAVASTRLMDMMLIEKERNDGKLPFKMGGKIRIENGSFSWDGRIDLFSDLNIDVERGRITSLIGRSGSGKTTLVQILQRKYYLSKGLLLVDAIPAESFDLVDFRKNIGVVPQNIIVFNGTIADNILVGRPANGHSDLIKRITELGFDQFIQRFEYGIYTQIGEDGRQLSGGELQLLAILRALYDSPEVLIIDEALSAIDLEFESIVFDKIKEYSLDHAVLLITHNLYSIMKTDYTYILQDGKIIQEGKPEELMRQTGYFHALCSSINFSSKSRRGTAVNV